MTAESTSTTEAGHPHPSTKRGSWLVPQKMGAGRPKSKPLLLKFESSHILELDYEAVESAPSLSEACSETESTSSEGLRGIDMSDESSSDEDDIVITEVVMPKSISLQEIKRTCIQSRASFSVGTDATKNEHNFTVNKEWTEDPSKMVTLPDGSILNLDEFEKFSEHPPSSIAKSDSVIPRRKGYLIPKVKKDDITIRSQRRLSGNTHEKRTSCRNQFLATGSRRASTGGNRFCFMGERRRCRKPKKEQMYRSEALTVPEDKVFSKPFPELKSRRRRNSLSLLQPPEVLRMFGLSTEGEDIDVWNDDIEELKKKLHKVASKRVEKEVQLGQKLKRKESEVTMTKQQVAELGDNVMNLEAKLNDFQVELDKRMELSGKMTSDHLRDMTEAQQIYRKMQRDSAATVDRLNKDHDREINRFEMKLRFSQARDQKLQKRYEEETEALRNHIKATEEARERTLAQLNEVKKQKEEFPARNHHFWLTPRMFLIFTIVSTYIAVYFGSQESFEQGLDFLCSPARPGMHLTAMSAEARTFEAPWWVPSYSTAKADVFSALCGPRQRSKLTWLPANKKGRGILKLFKLAEHPGAGGATTASEKSAWTRHIVVSAEMQHDLVKIIHQTGNIERLATLK